jgi:hypothetical protein
MEKMNKQQCLLHLLRISDHLKYVAHHQVVTRYVLESLLLDNRLDLPLYKEISDIISANKLLEHDHLFHTWAKEQKAALTHSEPPPAKVFISARPKPRKF